MPVYSYEAKNTQGVTIKGQLEAVDEVAVTAILREKSYYPVKVQVYKDSMNLSFSDLKKVKLKDISIFCRQFSVIISAGISIMRGLDIVKEQTENPKLRRILSSVFDDVQKGKALSEAMGEFKEIPRMLVNMVSVGEASGTLDKIMETMADYYDKEYKQRQKIKQALTYPAVVCIFALLVVTIMVVKVIPIFANMISSSGGQMPTPTRIVLAISDFISRFGICILLAVAAVVLLRKFLAKDSGDGLAKDGRLMKMPLVGPIYKKIVTARFARTFGILMSSGVPLIDSIDICADVVGSKTVHEVLSSLKEEVKKGMSLGESLAARGIFPVMLTQMIRIGEESGNLDEILQKTAEFYDGEVESATAQLTALLEPIIIIFLAIVVGFIILSVILPVFSMYDSVG